MNEPLPEPVTVWRFIRRHFVRIVIGAALVAAVYCAILVFVTHQTYQREKRITRKIEDIGGKVGCGYRGPNWVPHSIRNRMPLLDRITFVNLSPAGETGCVSGIEPNGLSEVLD